MQWFIYIRNFNQISFNIITELDFQGWLQAKSAFLQFQGYIYYITNNYTYSMKVNMIRGTVGCSH